MVWPSYGMQSKLLSSAKSLGAYCGSQGGRACELLRRAECAVLLTLLSTATAWSRGRGHHCSRRLGGGASWVELVVSLVGSARELGPYAMRLTAAELPASFL